MISMLRRITQDVTIDERLRNISFNRLFNNRTTPHKSTDNIEMKQHRMLKFRNLVSNKSYDVCIL